MSIGSKGTHWKGPLLSSEAAGDGLFEDFPAVYHSLQDCFVWQTQFLDHTLAQYWTQTNVTAGTAAITQETANPILSLTHTVDDQGPSVRWLGTDGRGNTIYNSGASSQNIFEARLTFQLAPTTTDCFIGMIGNGAASPAAHPLLGTGQLNLAAILDGMGFHWLNGSSAIPIPVVWANGAAQTLTGFPSFGADTTAQFRLFGCRYEVNAAATSTRLSWFINRRRVFSTALTINSGVFTSRMTFAFGTIRNTSNSQTNLQSLTIGRRNPVTFPIPEA